MPNILNFRKLLLFWGDIVLLYLSLIATLFFDLEEKFDWEFISSHLFPLTIVFLLWLATIYVFGLYDLHLLRKRFTLYTRTLGAASVSLVIGMLFFYLFPLFDITPKTNLFLNVLIFALLLLGWRKLFYSLFSSRFLNKTAIVGGNTKHLAEEIAKRPYLGYRLVDIDPNQDLLAQIKEKDIDTIIVPNDLAMDSKLIQDLYKCLPARITFMDLAQAYELICNKIPVSFITHTWFLENLKEGEKVLYDKTKAAFDVILAGIILLTTLPLWPFIALAIKINNKGPIIYRQQRFGKDRKPFFLFKFRSMTPEAEQKTGAVWAKKDDPRVTRVGKWLRRLHLDEIPQMFNVLRGEISLVGPRPERPEFVQNLEKEIPHYSLRHLIKPGFTGWAQLKFRYGRSVMDSEEKFQYDLYYMKNRNLLLDLGILLKTLQLFFKKES